MIIDSHVWFHTYHRPILCLYTYELIFFWGSTQRAFVLHCNRHYLGMLNSFLAFFGWLNLYKSGKQWNKTNNYIVLQVIIEWSRKLLQSIVITCMSTIHQNEINENRVIDKKYSTWLGFIEGICFIMITAQYFRPYYLYKPTKSFS